MSASNFYGSICLTDIPKELITTGKNGKKYLSIVVNERREPGRFGHTHYIKAYAGKDSRIDSSALYIGELKPSKFENREEAAAQPTTAAVSLEVADEAPVEDLPF